MVMCSMLVDMDDAEIERLRKTIRRTYASQPHKIKFWLALLEMYGKPDRVHIDRGAVHDAAQPRRTPEGPAPQG
jgi:hypothetical protein